MNRLEIIAENIVIGYVAVYSTTNFRLPVCLYNGEDLNGEFNELGDLVRGGLHAKGISLASLTLSRGDSSMPNHYNVDVKWFLNNHLATSEK